MTILSPLPIQQFKDSNGNPLAGGLLYTYAAGTSTPQSTFTDVTGATPNTNPIVLNSRGEAQIWLSAGLTYKFLLQDAAANLIWTVDQITSGGSGGSPIALASAATTDIGGQASSAVEISGTTTITSFGVNYIGPRFLRFTGALTLTQSAALNLPGGANITTVAGDTAIAYPNLALSGWNVVAYTKYTVTATAAAIVYPPIRQTVLSGPVDTNGLSAFGGATGNTVVTTAGTLVMTAANDVLNRIGTKLNPSWTGLSTNGTMYLYADLNADGTLTEGSGTQAPIYQWGGTPAITSGLFTFNIQEAKGYIGTGAIATAGYRVFVGEVTVAAGVTTAIVWYALMGRYKAPAGTTIANGSRMSFNHNIGTGQLKVRHVVQFVNAVQSYSVGDQIELGGVFNNTTLLPVFSPGTDRLTVGAIGATSAVAVVIKTTASYGAIALTDVNYAPIVERNF